MQEIIDGKLKELKELGAVSRDLKTWVDQSNLWYWIYSLFELEGTPVERKIIVDIVDGKIVENAPLDVYRLILNFKDVYSDMRSCAEMDQDADPKILLRWAEMLLEKDVIFRKGSPVIYEWNHIPPVAAESEGETTRLLREYARRRRSGITIRDMGIEYMEILRLYAFDRDTVRVAGLVLMYNLLREGYPLPGLFLSDTEFNKMIDEYVNNADENSFVNLLERSVLNRLDSVLQLSKQAAEINDK